MKPTHEWLPDAIERVAEQTPRGAEKLETTAETSTIEVTVLGSAELRRTGGGARELGQRVEQMRRAAQEEKQTFAGQRR